VRRLARGGPLWLASLLLLASACGVKTFTPPAGPGTPFPDYAPAFEQATAQCRSVKTIKATLSLSGRTGEQRLRGRVDAGFAAPSSARLEGRAPFGRPMFILVARDDSSATLVLPRDNRVLQNAPPAAIVEALAGVPLGPAELRSVMTGCGFGSDAPSDAKAFGDWLAIAAGSATDYLRQVDGQWRLVAASRGPLTIEYADFLSGRPSTVRIRSGTSQTAGSQTDITVKLSEVSSNVTLEAEVFRQDIPPGADPLTIEELRRAGPLGDSAR
jgi:outer membrane lipoprotein-sorting protein